MWVSIENVVSLWSRYDFAFKFFTRDNTSAFVSELADYMMFKSFLLFAIFMIIHVNDISQRIFGRKFDQNIAWRLGYSLVLISRGHTQCLGFNSHSLILTFMIRVEIWGQSPFSFCPLRVEKSGSSPSFWFRSKVRNQCYWLSGLRLRVRSIPNCTFPSWFPCICTNDFGWDIFGPKYIVMPTLKGYRVN